jgi:hypothetical protein
MSRIRFFLAVTAVPLMLAFAPVLARGATGTPHDPEQFEGVIANMLEGGTTQVTVHIDSYSSPEDVRSLATLLEDRGQDAVAAAMFRMKARGWIRIGSSLGYEVPIIRSIPTAKGREIVIVVDRPIQIWEQWRGTRSLQYPFGMIVLNLDESGHGTGKFIAAMRARFDKEGHIELESYGTEPLVIIGVRPEAVS